MQTESLYLKLDGLDVIKKWKHNIDVAALLWLI